MTRGNSLMIDLSFQMIHHDFISADTWKKVRRSLTYIIERPRSDRFSWSNQPLLIVSMPFLFYVVKEKSDSNQMKSTLDETHRGGIQKCRDNSGITIKIR